MSDAVAGPLTEMERAREATLRFVGDLHDAALRAWPNPDFSPVGWHLGHVGFTEALWALRRFGDDDSLCGPFAHAFAQDGRPKHERSALPPRDELLGYLAEVRARVRALAGHIGRGDDPLLQNGFLFWFLAAHEHQHRETMAFVRTQEVARRAPADPGARALALPLEALADDGHPPQVALAGGEVTLGTDDPLAYDNERPATRVTVAPFRLDAHPVTCAAWARFVCAGGYDDRRLWSDAGWAWRREAGVQVPFAWCEVAPGRFVRAGPLGPRRLDGREPVYGVSAHEAEAFARFRGARLPTEAEWEHACRATPPGRTHLGLAGDGPAPVEPDASAPTDLLGQVWEWTASCLEPRPGFEPFPYRGYSTPYFGGTHRVLKGGSFATSPAIARPAFRNFYLPHIRPMFAGLRCATDASPARGRAH